MSHYEKARTLHIAHQDAFRAALTSAPIDQRKAVKVEWQAKAQLLPNIRHAELMDVSEAISRALEVERVIFDLPELPALILEPKNWLVAGGLSKRGKKALDAITPEGWKIYISGAGFGWSVYCDRVGSPHFRHNRSFYKPAGGEGLTYNRTAPRTYADLIAADDELKEVVEQLRRLDDRKYYLQRMLEV